MIFFYRSSAIDIVFSSPEILIFHTYLLNRTMKKRVSLFFFSYFFDYMIVNVDTQRTYIYR